MRHERLARHQLDGAQDANVLDAAGAQAQMEGGLGLGGAVRLQTISRALARSA